MAPEAIGEVVEPPEAVLRLDAGGAAPAAVEAETEIQSVPMTGSAQGIEPGRVASPARPRATSERHDVGRRRAPRIGRVGRLSAKSAPPVAKIARGREADDDAAPELVVVAERPRSG